MLCSPLLCLGDNTGLVQHNHGNHPWICFLRWQNILMCHCTWCPRESCNVPHEHVSLLAHSTSVNYCENRGIIIALSSHDCFQQIPTEKHEPNPPLLLKPLHNLHEVSPWKANIIYLLHAMQKILPVTSTETTTVKGRQERQDKTR